MSQDLSKITGFPWPLREKVGILQTRSSVFCFLKLFLTTFTDFKSELILSDVSTQYSSHGVSLTIFGPEGGMPQVSAGDVVLATQVKVSFRRKLSLLKSCLTGNLGAKIQKQSYVADNQLYVRYTCVLGIENP